MQMRALMDQGVFIQGSYLTRQNLSPDDTKGDFRMHNNNNFSWQKRGLLIFAISLLVFLCSLDVLAAPVAIQAPENKGVILEEKDIAVRKKLAAQVERILKDPAVAEKIVSFGEQRTIFCKACHGKDGNAVREGVPNLAGQNPVYLLDQFQRFSDGRRYDFAMSNLSSSFSEDEKVYLALYYSRLEVRPAESVDPDKLTRGQKTFQVACAQCHGKDGHGNNDYARLASQKADYVLKMLNEFRSSTGRRSNPWMKAVALQLNEAEMTDVAAYISSMQ